MNRVKRYIKEKGFNTTTPDIGWEMYSGKYPLDCGAIWSEGHWVDSEHCVQYEYLNVLGWVCHAFTRDGNVVFYEEDDWQYWGIRCGYGASDDELKRFEWQLQGYRAIIEEEDGIEHYISMPDDPRMAKYTNLYVAKHFFKNEDWSHDINVYNKYYHLWKKFVENKKGE